MSSDLRRYARQTNARLVTGLFLLLLIVGDGLILVFFGPRAAVMGLLCIVAGSAPLILISLVLNLLDALVRRINES